MQHEQLRDALADYLRLRRRLGFEMPQDGRLLEGFVDFCEQAGAARITTELALAWARTPAHAHPHRWRQRLSVVRGFARHVATVNPASEVPSTDLLPGHRPRLAPYIYTDAEITALMAAAGRLGPTLRAARHHTLIGLLAVTGMRPGEALALDRHDVDLRRGVVHVRVGKQNKQREVPLHATTIRALRDYARLRDTHLPASRLNSGENLRRGRRCRCSSAIRTSSQSRRPLTGGRSNHPARCPRAARRARALPMAASGESSWPPVGTEHGRPWAGLDGP